MRRLLIFILSIICLFSSCTSLKNYTQPIPTYDQKTYESLTFLKADIILFYDTFSIKPDESVYKDFIVRFSRLYEYEKGKKGNEEVAEQVNIIKNMLIRHCHEAPYSKVMLENKKEIICSALDIVISTEYTKKRAK